MISILLNLMGLRSVQHVSFCGPLCLQLVDVITAAQGHRIATSRILKADVITSSQIREEHGKKAKNFVKGNQCPWLS